jgi:hypothetical protein
MNANSIFQDLIPNFRALTLSPPDPRLYEQDNNCANLALKQELTLAFIAKFHFATSLGVIVVA